MKKWIALLLALVLALGLVACGGTADDAADDADQTQEPAVTENDAEEPEAPADDADTADDADQTQEPEAPADDTAEEPEADDAAEEAGNFTQVNIGDTVTLDTVGLEITTTGFQYGDEMIAGWGISDHDPSNKYFWLGGTAVNVGTETLDTLGLECTVEIVFDDTYTYTGDLLFENLDGIGPFAQSNIYFWADVPPAMLERYQTVKVRFGFNDGFGEYDWMANSERVVTGYTNQYEFVLGDAAAAE